MYRTSVDVRYMSNTGHTINEACPNSIGKDVRVIYIIQHKIDFLKYHLICKK